MTPVASDAMPPPDRLFETRRAQELARLWAYYTGTQYDGRPDFWTGRPPGGGAPVPLRERKPLVVYPLAKAAVRQAVRFTFGEGRYPRVTCDEQAADEAGEEPLAVSKDDAAVISRAIESLTSQAALKPLMRVLMAHGLAMRTAVAAISVRDGRFHVETPFAKDCWATFRHGDSSDEVLALVWCYQFEKLVTDKDGRISYKRHWFRRDYTQEAIVEYHDAPVEVGKSPEWRAKNVTAHNFGFCPVVWIPNRIDEASGGMDGVSLYEGLEDEFDALNFALSQRHRGIVVFGIPQPYETGVEDGDGPGAEAASGLPSGPVGFGGDEPPPFGAAAPKPVRASGPDAMWSYSGDKVTLGLLETSGKSFEVATAHVNDIRQRLLEAMSVVLVNADNISGRGDMSAKFLSMVFQDLLSLVDDLREVWWRYGLERVLTMMLRIVHALGGKGLILPNAEKVAAIVGRRVVDTEGGPVFVPLSLTCTWGDYFSPSVDDIHKQVTTATLAHEKGIVPKRAAVAYVQEPFGISDVDAAVQELAAEADQEHRRVMEGQHALAALAGSAPADVTA